MKAKTSVVGWIFVVVTALLAVDVKAQSDPSPLSASEVNLYARLLMAADQRDFDSSLFLEGTTSRSTPVRWAASLKLAQLSRAYREETLPLLRQLAASRDTALAANAIFGLGLAKDTNSISLLASWTTREIPVARAAAWALGEIGANALPTLVSLLGERRSPLVLGELLFAAAKIRPMPVDALVPHLKSKSSYVIGAAAYAIARQGTSEGAVHLLTLSHHDPFIKSQVARGLRRSAVDDSLTDKALDILRQLYRDGYISVRVSAVFSLASYGAFAEDDILYAVNDRDASVRIAAAQALGYVLSPYRSIWSRLYEADTTFAFRVALVESSVRAGAALPELNSWRTHSNWRYRAAFVRSYGGDYDTLTARTVALLATYDPESRVRTAAYEVLAASDPDRNNEVVQRVLDDAMNDPDPVAREAIPWYVKVPTDLDILHSERDIGWYEGVVRQVVIPALSGPPRGATIQTDRGTIKVAFASLQAPITTYNFINLAQRGFYQVTRFHRVVPNFVAQDGDPRGDGNGGPGYSIRDEFSRESYSRGTVGMATAGPDTGGSQYFLTLSPQPHLEGHYTVFGRVVTGMAIMDALIQGDMIRSISIP